MSPTAGNGPIAGYTDNYNLRLINFNWVTWHDHEWQNWIDIDAVLQGVTDGFLPLIGGTLTGDVWVRQTTYPHIGVISTSAPADRQAMSMTISDAGIPGLTLRNSDLSLNHFLMQFPAGDATLTGITAPPADDSVMTRARGDARYMQVGPVQHPVYTLTPQQFGAVGDGIADDTAAIQAAIDSLETTTGGTLFFPRGVYRITATLTLTGSNITLLGAAASSSYSDTAVPSEIRWGLTTLSAATFMLDIGDTTKGGAVTRRPCLQNLGFNGKSFVSGVRATWAPEMLIEACSFAYMQTALYLRQSGGYGRNYSDGIRDNYFYNFSLYAIQTDEDAHRCNIVGNTFTTQFAIVPTGVILIGGTGNSTVVNISNNNFEPRGDNGSAVIYWIDARRARCVNINNNYFEVPAGTSIRGSIRLGRNSDVNDLVDAATITGNRFHIPTDAPDYATNTKRAIVVQRAKGVFVAGNNFTNFNSANVYLDPALAADIANVVYLGNQTTALATEVRGSGAAGTTYLAINNAVTAAVTGSRGGNAALADLLTKLAAIGLITNSTSA